MLICIGDGIRDSLINNLKGKIEQKSDGKALISQ